MCLSLPNIVQSLKVRVVACHHPMMFGSTLSISIPIP